MKQYPGYIPIEQLVSKQIDRIMHYRTIRKYDFWEDGIEGLIDLLTPEDEQKALEYIKTHNIRHNTSANGRELYSGLLRYIKGLFAEKGIIWNIRGYTNRGGGGIGFEEDIGIEYSEESTSG